MKYLLEQIFGNVFIVSESGNIYKLSTKQLCMVLCVSVGGQAGCEIWIDVSI